MYHRYRKNIVYLLVACFLFVQTFAGSPVFAQTDTSMSRLAGDDRYKTAVAISQSGWEKAEYAVLARGDNFADALCAGPLAYHYNGPILLTKSDSIPSDVLGELNRLGVKHLFIAGGTGAISQGVEDALLATGISTVERIAGDNRYETAVKIAEKLGNTTQIAVATGEDFPDALSISVISSKLGIPILLTKENSLPKELQTYINARQINKSYVIGGEGVISKSLEQQLPSALRLAGDNRYETNIAILKHFANELSSFKDIFVATGTQFADALTGTVLAAKSSSFLILTASELPQVTATYLTDSKISPNKIIGLGGAAVVKGSALEAVVSSASGSPAPIGGGGGSAPAIPTTATVNDSAAFLVALQNDHIRTITLSGDITGNVTATRTGTNGFTVNFGTYALIGDLDLTAGNATSIAFTGTAVPSITGNLSVAAAKATVTNGVNVGGKITVKDVGKHSWVEQADGNKITLTDDNGASIVIEGHPEDFTIEPTADGGINITAKKPVKITVNAGANVSSITATGDAAGTTITNNGNVASVTTDVEVGIANNGSGTVASVTANADVTIENNNASGTIAVGGSGTVGTTGTAANQVTSTGSATIVEGISNLGINPAELRLGGVVKATITGATKNSTDSFNVTSANPAVVSVDAATGLDITAQARGTTALKVQVKDASGTVIKQGTIGVTVLPAKMTAASVSMQAPVRGALPQTVAQIQAATNNPDYTVSSVIWNEALASNGKFKPSQIYTATIVLFSKNNKLFDETPFTPLVAGATSVTTTTTLGTSVGNRVSFEVTFPVTEDALAVDVPRDALSVGQDPGQTGGKELNYSFNPTSKTLTIANGLVPYIEANGNFPPSSGNWVGVAIKTPEGFTGDIARLKIDQRTYDQPILSAEEQQRGELWYYFDASKEQSHTLVINWSDAYLAETIVINTENITCEQAPTPMEITSNIPTFIVNKPEILTVSTIANNDLGKMVRAYFTLPSGVTLEYQEGGQGDWLPLTNVFGPSSGFPLGDITSTFRGTVAAAGTYEITVEFKTVPDGKVLGSKNITVIAEQAPSLVEKDPGLTGGAQAVFDATTNTFSGTIDFYCEAPDDFPPATGNYVGVKITAPEGVTVDSQKATFTYTNAAEETTTLVNGTTPWLDGDNYVYYYPFVTAERKTFEVIIDWDGEGTYQPETITIQVADDAILEAPPELESVSPERGPVTLDYGQNFVLIVDAYDAVGLAELEIDHNMEDQLSEFSVYADADNPYGTSEDQQAYETAGVEAVYDATEQKWTINFGANVTSQLVAKKDVKFYLVIKDTAGNQFGTMYGTTPENTFAYTITQNPPVFNGLASGVLTTDKGVVTGTLTGDYNLTVNGHVTAYVNNRATFTGTVSGDINGDITATINDNGIDTMSGTITKSGAVQPVRIIGTFPQSGISGDFCGQIITGPLPDYVQTMSIATPEDVSTLAVGQTLQLSVNIGPETASKDVVWSLWTSEGESSTIATITPEGVLTGVGSGTITVIAKALDGSLMDATKTITIN